MLCDPPLVGSLASHANFNDGHVHLLSSKKKQSCNHLKLEDCQCNLRPQDCIMSRCQSLGQQSQSKTGNCGKEMQIG